MAHPQPPPGSLLAEGTFTGRGKDFCYRIVDLRVLGTFEAYAPRLTPQPAALIGDLLVLIFRCDHSKPLGESLTKAAIQFYFTLKSSNPDADAPLGIPSILELYDFVRNKSKNGTEYTTKGVSIPALMFFLKKILPSIRNLRFRIFPNILLWLGTVEPKLAEVYRNAGFTPFGDGHTISPLGVPFPRAGWSFLLPISAAPPPASRPALSVAASTLERALSRPIELQIDIPAATVQYIYDKLVLHGKAENALVFASQVGIGSAVDTAIQWNGKKFLGSPSEFKAVETPVPFGGDPTKTHVSLSAAVFSEHLAKNVTGHTHPVVLYMIMGELAKQDISPPSEQDLKLVWQGKSPLHLVWSPECVYSIQINPEVAANPSTHEGCAEQLTSTIASRVDISRLCFLRIDIVEPVIEAFYNADRELEHTIPRVPPPEYDPVTKNIRVAPDDPSYLAYKKFKVELACHLYTISAAIMRDGRRLNILRIMPHYYTLPGSAVTGLNPQPSCITFTPFTLLTTRESLSTAERETEKAAAFVSGIAQIASTRESLDTIIEKGKPFFRPCPDGKCPSLPPLGVTFKTLDSNGRAAQATFREGETLHSILLSALEGLPAAGAGAAAAAADAGALVTRITVTPAIGNLYSRSLDGTILDIRSLVLEGNQSSGRITSTTIRPDGSKLTATIEYHSRHNIDGTVKIFTDDIEAYLKGITVHTSPGGGGYKRRSRRRSSRRSSRRSTRKR